MRRDDLAELHFITPIANVASILELGILSERRAQKVDHVSVALAGVQEKRSRIRVPEGRPLHEYANLYICARNPMLYRRHGQHRELCVLRVSPKVLHLPDVVVTDGNAASDYTRFAAAPEGLAIVDSELTFAEWWTSSNQFEQLERSRRKCAEVLVPEALSPPFIEGAYVSCNDSLAALSVVAPDLPVEVNPHLFFLLGL